MLDRSLLRQHGAKSIAVDSTALSKSFAIYLMPIMLCVILTIGWYHGDFASVFWVILALAGIAYGYFYTHNHHADEVWETPEGFVIIIGEKYQEVRFADIDRVEYKFRYWLDSQNYIVEFHFCKPNQFGNKIFFVTWEDACNYNQEMKIFRIKNQATPFFWLCQSATR